MARTSSIIDIQVGYLHRGFEKECESGTWYQCIPYTDRLNYNSAVLANIGFCLAVEKLLGIETPERCQWLRVLAIGDLAGWEITSPAVAPRASSCRR